MHLVNTNPDIFKLYSVVTVKGVRRAQALLRLQTPPLLEYVSL